MRYIDKKAFFDSIGYTPHSAAQWSYHNSTARFKAPVCGRRFGKSTMAGRDAEPELLIPNRRYWIVGPNYDLGEKEFRVIWDDLIVTKQLGRDKRVKKAYNKRVGDMYIEFPWQTRLEVRSAAHPESLVGEALHGVIMSEAAKHSAETWDRFVRPALNDYRGWATFPTTPEGHNWLYRLWQMGRNPKYEGVYESWNFPSWLNSKVYPGGRDDPEIKLLEMTMAPEQFLQEIAADFASFTGKIYSEFDENVHVQKCEYNPAWPNYIFFDFGFVNPLAAIEVQIDPMDNIYIWREHYKSYQTLEWHIAELKRRAQPADYKIDFCTGDAADPEAVEFISQHFAPCIADPNAKTNWRNGVNLVKRFLKEYEIGIADEYGTPLTKPKLIVDHSCTNTIREFNTYRRKESTKNDPTESGAAGAAQKQDDHALDALRYGLVHIYELGVTRHLSEVVDKSDYAVVSSDEGIFTSSGMEF